MIALAGDLQAAFTQHQCYPSALIVPIDVGASEFDTKWWTEDQYGHNQEYKWPLLVNSNVSAVAWNYLNFYSEPSFDRLSVQHYSGTQNLSGSLGSGGTNFLVPMFVPPTNRPRFFNVGWRSDSTILGSSPSLPRFSSVFITCLPAPNPTESHTPITVNDRWDGILMASGDVIYTSVTQPANTRMYLTLDALAGTPANLDFDLYASTTNPLPDDANHQWRDWLSNTTNDLTTAGAALDLGATVGPRTVYIGVRSWRGAGHFLLRANVAKTAYAVTPLNVCHPGVSNIQSHPNWPSAKNAIAGALTRLSAATHGNIYHTNVIMRYVAGTGGDDFCSGAVPCDWCMTSTAFPDYCGAQEWNGRVRIPNISCMNSEPFEYNDPRGLSLVFAHEELHRLFVLPDEYKDGFGSWCGHSIMNGPFNYTYRLCKPIDHCYDPAPGLIPPAEMDCSGNSSGWSRIAGLYATQFVTLPNLYSYSAQPWKRSYDNLYARNLHSFSYQ